MGNSALAHLAYGVNLQCEDDYEDEYPEFLKALIDEVDDGRSLSSLWEYYIEKQSGLPLYGEEGHSFKDHHEFEKSFIADLQMYCHYEYTRYCIILRGTQLTSYDEATPVTAKDLELDPTRVQEFMQWLHDNAIEGKPQWLLTTFYG